MVCGGVRVGLRSSEAAGIERLAECLPRAARPARASIVHALYSLVLGGEGPRKGTRRFHVLYRDATQLARSLDFEDVRRAFGRDFGTVLAENARRRIFVHAGVVGIGSGVVMIPGASFSGKTTLVQALVARGGVYYSDEFAVVDSRGLVSPWAEPLSIRKHGALRPGEPHSADSLGLVTGKKALPVRLVVLTSYVARKRFRPRPVLPGHGVLGILEHTLSAQRRPRASLQALSSVIDQARVISGPRGEADEAARAIFRLLGASAS